MRVIILFIVFLSFLHCDKVFFTNPIAEEKCEERLAQNEERLRIMLLVCPEAFSGKQDPLGYCLFNFPFLLSLADENCEYMYWF